MERIHLLAPNDARVQRFLAQMFNHPALAAPVALLFGGDRWSCVEVVALLSVGGIDVGIATLSPTDEEGRGGPCIIGIWIDPEFKSHPEAVDYGMRLLARLIAESKKRYGEEKPTLTPVTQTEHVLARCAKERGLPLHIRNVGPALTDW